MSYNDYITAAIYNACNYVLKPLNAIETTFSVNCAHQNKNAIFHFNFAPLSCIRNIRCLVSSITVLSIKALAILKHSSQHYQRETNTRKAQAWCMHCSWLPLRTNPSCRLSDDTRLAKFGYIIEYLETS